MQSPSDLDKASTYSSESLETIEDYKRKGWVCATSSSWQEYPLIPEDDEWAEKFYDRGLINWCPKSPYNNTIHLCPNCHYRIQYCDINDPPSLIILPKNLQYLIDFEKQNRRDRRRAGAKAGLTPQRKMPTSFEYLTAGGLYKPIEIKPYLLVGCPPCLREEFLSLISRPKVWNGAPFALLRHVFPLMENEESFDEEARGQLQELYGLYFDDEVDGRDDKCDESRGDKGD